MSVAQSAEHGIKFEVNPLRVVATGEGPDGVGVTRAAVNLSPAMVLAASSSLRAALCGEAGRSYSTRGALPLGIRCFCRPLRLVVFGLDEAVELPLTDVQMKGVLQMFEKAARSSGYKI